MLIYCFKGSNMNCNSKCNKDEYDGRINYEQERGMRCCYMNSTAWVLIQIFKVIIELSKKVSFLNIHRHRRIIILQSCRAIENFIQYHNCMGDIAPRAKANGRQLAIIKRLPKFSCSTLLEIQQISLRKNLCDICFKCFNSPLAPFCSRLLERKQYVLNSRGKITASTNFAEIYASGECEA